jgi:DNA-binding transcriptional MerR regulator
LDRLLIIRSMKPLGFTLEEMAELLDIIDVLADGAAHPGERKLLQDYIRRADEKRNKLALNLTRADEFISDLRGR